MHHHVSYRGRTHTQKITAQKRKLSAEEKAIRKARKELHKLFPDLKIANNHKALCLLTSDG